MVRITGVLHGSLSQKAGIREGGFLVSINKNEINDVLDYRFYLSEKKVLLEVSYTDKNCTYEITKGEYEDIGLEFETPLMDKKHSCKNKCIFCFIDQNPKGMREPIYFKDDDSRLSFIHGNYITLTNMTDSDIERIIKMRMSPINISIHTTNPELRVKMMKNKNAGDKLRYLDDIANAGLTMCGQIVLCKGVNDGEELCRTLTDLSKYYPSMSSVAVVPAGLTKHREGLYPLADFSSEEASDVIDTVERFAKENKKKYGSSVFYLADEFYLKAKRDIPSEEYYEDYPQIENGVGLIRSLKEEFYAALDDIEGETISARRVTLATGAGAYPLMCELADEVNGRFPNITVSVKKIINNFFGQSITVSGLLTGKDIYEQLKDEELFDELLIPASCLREGDNDFLCGMTVDELSLSLNIPICAIDNDGYALLSAMLGIEI